MLNKAKIQELLKQFLNEGEETPEEKIKRVETITKEIDVRDEIIESVAAIPPDDSEDWEFIPKSDGYQKKYEELKKDYLARYRGEAKEPPLTLEDEIKDPAPEQISFDSLFKKE